MAIDMRPGCIAVMRPGRVCEASEPHAQGSISAELRSSFTTLQLVACPYPLVHIRSVSRPLINVRLRLLDDVWESLSRDAENVPVTDAQRNELDRRLADFESDTQDGLRWDEVLTHLRARKH